MHQKDARGAWVKFDSALLAGCPSCAEIGASVQQQKRPKMDVLDPSRPKLADPEVGSERLHMLLARHGELMAGGDLIQLFKFGSDRAFRRAAAAGRLPVAVVRVPGRPGWFARTRDVATWLDSLGTS
ncbi:hypothetical protein [Novilysobacter defluvii]|uniref:hypothetical protein n=1 Tax=Novilysobacter defluvii TaxID=391738 RepID=UPI0012B66CD8|nr:hypothetical protein [Lysobacter defluvii]